MWTARSENLSDDRGLRFALDLDSRPATVADVLRGWQSDAGFRALFNSLLAETPYTAFRWETPPVTAASVSQPFEFVLLDSPGLVRRPDPEAFAEKFRRGVEGVVVFPTWAGMPSWLCRVRLLRRRPTDTSRPLCGSHRSRNDTRFGSRLRRR